MFSIQREITAELLNPEFDHVHHAEIVRLLEEARLRLLDQQGFSLRTMIERGIFLVVSKIEVSYKREVKGGVHTITCDRVSVNGKKIAIEQSILNEKNKLCVSAVVESQCLSGDLGRAISPPEDFVLGISAFSDNNSEHKK